MGLTQSHAPNGPVAMQKVWMPVCRKCVERVTSRAGPTSQGGRSRGRARWRPVLVCHRRRDAAAPGGFVSASRKSLHNGMLVKRASVAFVAALLLLTAAAADAGWQQAQASGATARAYAIRVVVPDQPGAETPTVSAPEDSVVFSGSFDYNHARHERLGERERVRGRRSRRRTQPHPRRSTTSACSAVRSRPRASSRRPTQKPVPALQRGTSPARRSQTSSHSASP